MLEVAKKQSQKSLKFLAEEYADSRIIDRSMAISNRLRLENVSRILEALWHRPEKSRADLARDLRLDRSTVGIIADRLLELGLIREERFPKTGPKGGRPPLHLTIAPGTAYTIGVEFTAPSHSFGGARSCGHPP